MKRTIVSLIILTIGMHAARAASYWLGDINGDGKVSIVDLTLLTAILQGDAPPTVQRAAADVNRDGRVTIADVTPLLNIILHKSDMVQITTGGFTDSDMTDPGSSGTAGGFKDDEQTNPGVGGNGGGFKDDDMKDPV